MIDGMVKKIILSYLYAVIWIFLSFTVIIYNKYILDRRMYNWPFPISLTMTICPFAPSSPRPYLRPPPCGAADIAGNDTGALYLLCSPHRRSLLVLSQSVAGDFHLETLNPRASSQMPLVSTGALSVGNESVGAGELVEHGLDSELSIKITYRRIVLGTNELNAYLNKYRLELDQNLEALVGRFLYTGDDYL